MKRFFSVYNQYYANKGKSGFDFLTDCLRYLEARNHALNENKTVFALILDFCKKVEFDRTSRF